MRVKISAFDLYISRRMSIKEIANRIEVPEETIWNWFKRDGWSEKRKKLDREEAENHMAALTKLQHQERGNVMKQDIEISKGLKDEIQKKIDKCEGVDEDGNPKEMSTKEIVDLARATKSISSVSARVVGLDKSSAQAPSQPLVSISYGMMPQPIDDDEGEFMDAEYEAVPSPELPEPSEETEQEFFYPGDKEEEASA